MADVTVTPGIVAADSISISILDAEFGLLNAEEVSLILSNPAAGIEASGLWNIRAAILVSEFTEIELEDHLTIKPR
jgi:copper transport protein